MAYFQGTCVGSYGYIYDGIKHISPRSPYTNSKTLFKGQVTKFIQPITNSHTQEAGIKCCNALIEETLFILTQGEHI